jgi:chromosome segregation ATPase
VEERDQQIEALRLAQTRERKNYENQRQTLREEITSLRQQLDEEIALIERLQRATPEPAPVTPDPTELAAYETELNEFRQQLQADRLELDQEIQQLRDQDDLVIAAPQALPMQMRERAPLAGQRSQLDRLRDELRVEMERLEHQPS